MGSAFTMVSANIYMLEWEQSLIEHQQTCGELYGRSVLVNFYVNEILYSFRFW